MELELCAADQQLALSLVGAKVLKLELAVPCLDYVVFASKSASTSRFNRKKSVSLSLLICSENPVKHTGRKGDIGEIVESLCSCSWHRKYLNEFAEEHRVLSANVYNYITLGKYGAGVLHNDTLILALRAISVAITFISFTHLLLLNLPVCFLWNHISETIIDICSRATILRFLVHVNE